MAASLEEPANDDLMKQLECPVCFEYCTPPIYMCRNGHNVCSTCRISLNQCGICRAPGQPSIRNLPIEGISNLLVKVKCKHYEIGCQKLFTFKDLQKHLPNCEYSYECRFDCCWKGKVADLEMHAVNAHSNLLWECLRDTVVHLHLIPTHYCYCLTLFAAEGYLFWYTHEFDVVNEMFSVSVVQAKVERELGVEFIFSVEFESKNKKNKCRIESTVGAYETSTRMSRILLVDVLESYKKDELMPFKFSIHFDGKHHFLEELEKIQLNID